MPPAAGMYSTVALVLSAPAKFGAACCPGPQCGQSIHRIKSTISLGRLGFAMISKWAGTALLPQTSHVMFLGRNMASTLSLIVPIGHRREDIYVLVRGCGK